MGTQRQPGWLSGLLIPWPVTLAGTLGTDYTIKDPKPGRFVAGGTSLLSLLPSVPPGVSPDAGVNSIDVQAIAAGAPGPGGAGLAYRINGAGLWYGADSPNVMTGAQFIDSASPLDVTAVALADGRAVICYATSTAVYVQTRSAAGVWGSPVSVLATTQQLACVTMAPDGALHVYAADTLPSSASVAIRCYRSTDAGATWTRQSYDVGAGTTASGAAGDHLRAASTGGSVVLFRTVTSTTLTQQWASSDGGFNFSLVASDTATTVWGISVYGGVMHIATAETVAAATSTYYRALGSPFSSLWSTTATEVHTTGEHTRSSAIVVAPEGRAYVMADSADAGSWPDSKTSALANTTSWTVGGPNVSTTPDPADYVEAFTAVWVRGTLLLIGSSTGNGSGSSTELVEVRFGGHSQATVSGGLGSAPWFWTYLPIQTFAAQGYADTDTGTVTRDFAPSTGQRIATATTSSAESETVGAANSGSAAFLFTARATSGALLIDCHTRGSGTGVTLRIRLTSTTVQAHDAGGSSTAVPHGTSGYLQILAIVDPTNSRAFVVWRPSDAAPERAWSELPAVTGMAAAGTTIKHVFSLASSSEAYILTASHGTLASNALGNGWTRPSELDPVPLAMPPLFGYLTSGVEVQSAGGIASADGVTHTSTMTSPYRAANVIPQTSPSPRAVWRSSQVAADETLTLTLGSADRPAIVGVYLDGLVGVSSLDIVAGLATSTVDLSTSIKFTTLSGRRSIEPSPTGALRVGRPWVKADELKGWRFKDQSGGVHEVTGNTAGSLTYGSPAAELRAVIHLATQCASATNQTGTLYPPRALLFAYLDSNDDVESVSLEVVAANNYTPTEGYRQIGVAAVGRVHLFGVSPDLNDALTLEPAANVQTMQDGQRYTRRMSADRRRVEIAFANSPHEARDMFGTSTSPDYVIAYTGGPIAGDSSGIPLLMEGLARRAANTSNGLVVWCPRIVAQASTGWVVQTFGLDATVYGRLTAPFRREGVQMIGERGASQVFRVPTIVIEEEL